MEGGGSPDWPTNSHKGVGKERWGNQILCRFRTGRQRCSLRMGAWAYEPEMSRETLAADEVSGGTPWLWSRATWRGKAPIPASRTTPPVGGIRRGYNSDLLP